MACCGAATLPFASAQSIPADAAQNAAQAPSAGPAAPHESNPFPEDTSTVPVLPSKVTPALPDGTYTAEDGGAVNGRAALPGEDTDPVRSPDDPEPAAASVQEQDSSSSSSLSGLDKILPKPDDDQPEGKKRKLKVEEPVHQETAASDIDVGKYYLQIKNWKAAQSRFESAMVLDPQNPEVYWGLAETERHLGKFGEAHANYLKLLDYDPEGPHAKEARKALKDPEIENAANPLASQMPAATPK
jgi:tetratricopeptide (TPR) repeat protein